LHSAGGANARPSDGSLSTVTPTMEPVDSFNSDASNSETLRYSSPVFLAPLHVRGPAAVELYGASSSAEVELTATIVDIGPDLTGAVIASATGAATASDAAHIAVDLGDLDHTFAVGHRLRLDFGAASSGGLSAHHVFHDAVRPSCVVLPIA
jgi:predicted acyl esterase